ncbi:hypothetical protein [Cryptosporangium aurantiacum]|uniref:Uncharacterized protein n=1 Tax=Cryptosporangium aurantiacum TaxID=134849 RepID=A0A1M7R8W1_9ACTN|nr:hypothetical protein [Cryptosporangium aurantiacum]SHN42775.1 hypothetical protein SAMN05443668_108373 [Cryptosporangium aurantiacum]
MTTDQQPSALAAALTAPYRRTERTSRIRRLAAWIRTSEARPRRVVVAAILVGLQATVFLLSALRHASEQDFGTAAALGVGFVVAALVAYGLSRGNSFAFVMTLGYTSVDVLLTAIDGWGLALGSLVLLILLVTPRSRAYFRG